MPWVPDVWGRQDDLLVARRATAQTPLTKFQFFKYFQEHEGKTPTECETKWNEMMAFALPEDMKDGEVRIRVCVDEYALHRNSKSRINEVRASKKRPNEEDDSQTAPASKKLKDADSVVNKLRLKLIDTLAEIEKSSKSVLAQESDMMKVVPADEQRTADYSLLITTLKIRLAALKLACDESADVSKVFSSIDLVGEMEGRAPEESLRKMRTQNAIALLAQLLKTK